MVFVALLGITFLMALLVTFILLQIARKPVDLILDRIFSPSVSKTVSKYLCFVMYPVGIWSGIEQFLYYPSYPENTKIADLIKPSLLSKICWEGGSETFYGIAWMLLAFFVLALIAFVVADVCKRMRKVRK